MRRNAFAHARTSRHIRACPSSIPREEQSCREEPSGLHIHRHNSQPMPARLQHRLSSWPSSARRGRPLAGPTPRHPRPLAASGQCARRPNRTAALRGCGEETNLRPLGRRWLRPFQAALGSPLSRSASCGAFHGHRHLLPRTLRQASRTRLAAWSSPQRAHLALT